MSYMFSFQKQSANFAPLVLSSKVAYASTDISVIISIRAHEGNPWVFERLELLGGYYKPEPVIVVVDFGSQAGYADRIREICAKNGFIYHWVDDTDVFSLSIARNEGASRAETDLIYFTDIDFFSAPNHFARLVDYADTHDFRSIRDVVLNVPAYHLVQDLSDEFVKVPTQGRQKFLEQLGIIASEKGRNEAAEFIAPYSNNFLCTRDFFQMTGGYDPTFRGHGSEDFELMIRFAHYIQHTDLPERLSADLWSPARDAFFVPRAYVGFRRLGEAVSFRAETWGFKAFHMAHPSPEGDPWRDKNDWKRNTFKSVLGNYLDDPSRLSGLDHIPRSKIALCVCKNPEHYAYFLPFRALGYKLEIISGDTGDDIAAATKAIQEKRVAALMIFNPYMKSHARFYPLFLLAKEFGIETIVAERGALPSSIYFAEDVSYNDPEFLRYDENPPEIAEDALARADQFSERVRLGGWTLEKLSAYQDTIKAYQPISSIGKRKVFIPLQLSDDMAVTKFVSQGQKYSDFERSISMVAEKNPDILFVVKAHPLKRDQFTGSSQNVVVCKNDDNVHALIELCDATICYNSGVGLLSLIHGKPTITIGNAFYNVSGTGIRAANFEKAVAIFSSGEGLAPNSEHVRRLLAWIITKKYSFFKAEDAIQQFQHRNSHGYQNIMVTHLNWKGFSIPMGRISAISRITSESYLNGRLGLSMGMPEAAFPKFKEVSTRGPIKAFFINYFKRPIRRYFASLKEDKSS